MKMLPLQTLMALGAIGTVIIVVLAMLNWRRAVYAALIVALFEGAIRKWIVPQASELVYFLKDIILLGAYIKFYMFPDPDVRGWRLQIPSTLIAAACLMVILAGAVNPNIGSVILALYGIKIYLWYLPLAFMMPFLFRNEEHMTRMMFRYALLAIPICLLGVAQFVAGADSWLNVYARSGFGEMQNVATFGEGSVKARITGTFSYISGHSTFVTVFFGLALGLLSGIHDKRRWVILLGVLPLIAANAYMSGSRAAVFGIALIAGCFMLMSGVYRLGKGGNLVPILILAAGAIMMITNLVFTDAVKEYQMRRKTAGDTITDRLMYPVTSTLKAASEVNITGFGIGMSHPASETIRAVLHIPPPERRCPVFDAEVGQVLAELGWPGFVMWYMLRILIVIHCWTAFRDSKPSTFRSLCLAFFSYQMLCLPNSVVLNHTANVFVFASWGFCLISRTTSLVSRGRVRTVSKEVSPQRTLPSFRT